MEKNTPERRKADSPISLKVFRPGIKRLHLASDNRVKCAILALTADVGILCAYFEIAKWFIENEIEK